MPVLEQFPHEITAEILSYLPQSDLISTCSLSRYMRAISQPVLYRAPILAYNEAEPPTPLQKLLRTLLSPGGETLAIYVHSFSIVYDGDDDNLDDDDDEPDTPDDSPGLTPDALSTLAMLVAAATPLGLQQYLKYQDGQLLLLLHLLPRLKILHFIPLHECGQSFFDFIDADMVALPADTLPHGLRQLREFWCPAGGDAGISPSNLLTVLSLPCIRKIHTQVVKASSICFETAKLAVATSTVTNLLFTEADNSQRSLECILKIPIALTHFAYSTGFSYPTFHMGVALQPLRASLKHLHLEFKDVPLEVGSLRDWPALQTIRCSLTVLLGKGPQKDSPRLSDVLPVGLRELAILRDRYWPVAVEVGMEVELLGQKAISVPALLTLGVDISQANLARDVRYQSTLRGVCVATGVALVDIGVKGRKLIGRSMARMTAPRIARPVRPRR